MDSLSENKKVAVLLGWNFKSAIVRYEEIPNRIFEIDISDIKNNKSAYWRRLKTSCKDTMGQEPNFTANVSLDTKKEKGNPITGGKPIELLTEIECQIYLKECLKLEDYETAELIRKQMEKYR